MSASSAPGREVTPAVRLAGFAAVLAVVFGASFGVGRAVATDEPAIPATTTTTSVDHGGHSG